MFPSTAGFGASTGGRLTFVVLLADSPSACVMVVVSGGFEPFAVWPFAPTVAVSTGAYGSASQAVGVKLPWPSAVLSPYPVACTAGGWTSREAGASYGRRTRSGSS